MRVIVVGSGPIVRAGIRRVLELAKIRVVADAVDASEAATVAGQVLVDAVVVSALRSCGATDTRTMASACPGVPVLLLGGGRRGDALESALEAGAYDYLSLDEASEDELVLAVCRAARARSGRGGSVPPPLFFR